MVHELIEVEINRDLFGNVLCLSFFGVVSSAADQRSTIRLASVLTQSSAGPPKSGRLRILVSRSRMEYNEGVHLVRDHREMRYVFLVLLARDVVQDVGERALVGLRDELYLAQRRMVLIRILDNH